MEKHERISPSSSGFSQRSFCAGVPNTVSVDQARASITEGLWYARSPEIIHSMVMETLVWMRVPGDVIFAAGGMFLALFAFHAWRGSRRRSTAVPVGIPAGCEITSIQLRAGLLLEAGLFFRRST